LFLFVCRVVGGGRFWLFYFLLLCFCLDRFLLRLLVGLVGVSYILEDNCIFKCWMLFSRMYKRYSFVDFGTKLRHKAEIDFL